MKIYYSVSISNMDDVARKRSAKIVSFLESLGHTVISKFNIQKNFSEIESQSEEESIEEQKRLTRLKKIADLIVVEATNPSFGVGQEIAISLSLSKPVIALYKNGSKPHILRDEGGDLLLLAEYTESNLTDVLSESLEYASNHQDVRFNFFISPSIGNYLDWISQSKKIPRSVYLRNLIEEDMIENKEYNP